MLNGPTSVYMLRYIRHITAGGRVNLLSRLKIRAVARPTLQIPNANRSPVTRTWRTEPFAAHMFFDLEHVCSQLLHGDGGATDLERRLQSKRCHLRTKPFLCVLLSVDAVPLSPEFGPERALSHVEHDRRMLMPMARVRTVARWADALTAECLTRVATGLLFHGGPHSRCELILFRSQFFPVGKL